jgi:hypothetical protein
MKELSEYDKQAQAFLDKFHITFKATWKGDKCPPWVDMSLKKANGDCPNCSYIHGDRYRVVLRRDRLLQRTPLSFDFWNSFHAKSEGSTELDAYHVLACISNDVRCPDTFEEFCAGYDYDADSIAAFKTFKRCARFAERLQAFFSEEEQVALQEIQ